MQAAVSLYQKQLSLLVQKEIFNERCSDKKVKKSILNFIRKREKLMNMDAGKDYRGNLQIDQ